MFNNVRNISFILCMSFVMQSLAIDWHWLQNSYVGKQCGPAYQRVRDMAKQHPMLASTGAVAGTLLLLAAALKFHHVYANYEQAKAAIDVEGFMGVVNYDDADDFDTIENITHDVNGKRKFDNFWQWVMPLIRDKKVSVNITGTKGISPLYTAVRALDIAHVKELKQYGADHNQKTGITLWDGTFDTPLKAAQRIPDNISVWKERKAHILDAFGDHTLLTNMELANELSDESAHSLSLRPNGSPSITLPSIIELP